MDVLATLDAPCPPDAVLAWVTDLDRYPAWLDIVARAEPTAPGDDGRAAWIVDLRGRLGPLARSKRLRMVRMETETTGHVRFERQELDGRTHSPWVLTATVDPTTNGSRLTMSLHYGGRLWGPVLERLLGDEIERAKPRLLQLVTDGG